jgi:hypothetical protein
MDMILSLISLGSSSLLVASLIFGIVDKSHWVMLDIDLRCVFVDAF